MAISTNYVSSVQIEFKYWKTNNQDVDILIDKNNQIMKHEEFVSFSRKGR